MSRMNDVSETSVPLSAAELRAIRLRYFMPQASSAGAGPLPDLPSDTTGTSAPATAPEPSAPEPSAPETSSSAPEPSSSAPEPSAPETAQAALTKKLHDIYMASYPVCVQMGHAFVQKGVSELSHFRGIGLKDLEQKLCEFYPFSGIQVKRVHAHLNPSEYSELYLSALAPQVVVISSPASTSDASVPANQVSDDDIPLVSFPEPRRPSKRRRTTISLDNLPIQLQTADFPTPDAIKSALKGCNSSCHPVCRSSSGKYIRFSCKNSTSSLSCPLNVSAARRDGCITLSPHTYVAGNCNNRICVNCHDDLTFFATCPNNHRFCLECFDYLVDSQVRSDRVSFIASNCEVFCRFCAPASIIDIQTHSNSLKKTTWQHYLEACSEGAVISEQKRWEGRMLTTPADPDDLAFVADLVVRKCPTCNRLMADDFDGCVALKCGRTSYAYGAGCGAHICAYCSEAFLSEHDVHQHVKTCVTNPNPGGDIYPTAHYFNAAMWQIRRERVWLHVLENLPDRVPTIWSAIAKKHPELKFTSDWLEQRAKCLNIAEEFAIATADFAKLLPQYSQCINALKEIFGGDDDETEQGLWRACIINKGNYEKTVRTIIDNT